jgi:uncharacterized protein (TIGR03435 family)
MNRVGYTACSILLAGALAGATLGAQAPSRPAFDVGVVDLLLNAYGLQGFQIVGIPAWTSSAHFDVAGAAPRQTALSSASAPGKQKEKNQKLRQTGSFEADAANEPSDLQLVIRAMLADRFRLRTHTDTRNVPIYALTRARRCW